VVGTRRIEIERGNKLEVIDLQVKVYAAQVHRPKHFGSGSGLADTMPIWVVEAQEVDTGQAQLVRWTLLCTERTESASDALRRLDDDVLRWRVERFHYTLKQGLKVERLQFDDARTLMNAVSAQRSGGVATDVYDLLCTLVSDASVQRDCLGGRASGTVGKSQRFGAKCGRSRAGDCQVRGLASKPCAAGCESHLERTLRPAVSHDRVLSRFISKKYATRLAFARRGTSRSDRVRYARLCVLHPLHYFPCSAHG